MEEHPALSATPAEMLVVFVPAVIFCAVVIASYRRARCLSGYRIWASVIIAVVAACFWPVWIIVSLVNHKQINAEWREYFTTRVSHAA